MTAAMASPATDRAARFWTASLDDRGWPAWLLAIGLATFYLLLYYTEVFTRLLPRSLDGKADKWTLYGILYTLAIVWGGVNFIRRNGRSRYQVIRTGVVILVQVVVALAIPTLMRFLGGKEFYFSYLWPLKIEYFYPQVIFSYPLPFVFYSFLGSLLVVPLLAVLFGKRFYCSWVCGCGGLANTFGDRWRHLSLKTRASWRFETVSIHSVLVLAVATTVIVVVNWGIGQSHPGLAAFAFRVQRFYGFVIGFILSGLAGVALYPLLGTRIWCRFFCPMAALLGLIQKLGRYRIATQGELCIACGNCSKYCEMGIDVRSYAIANESFTRASCVGCGICAHVCPRGVLKLELIKTTLS